MPARMPFKRLDRDLGDFYSISYASGRSPVQRVLKAELDGQEYVIDQINHVPFLTRPLSLDEEDHLARKLFEKPYARLSDEEREQFAVKAAEFARRLAHKEPMRKLTEGEEKSLALRFYNKHPDQLTPEESRGLIGAARREAYAAMKPRERAARKRFAAVLRQLRRVMPPGEALKMKARMFAQETGNPSEFFSRFFTIRRKGERKPLAVAAFDVSASGGTALFRYMLDSPQSAESFRKEAVARMEGKIRAGATEEFSPREFRLREEKRIEKAIAKRGLDEKQAKEFRTGGLARVEEKIRAGGIKMLSPEEFGKRETKRIEKIIARRYPGQGAGTALAPLIDMLKARVAEQHPDLVLFAETERLPTGNATPGEQMAAVKLGERLLTPTIDGRPVNYPDLQAAAEASRAQPGPKPAGAAELTFHLIKESGRRPQTAQELEEAVFSVAKDHYGTDAETAAAVAGRSIWGGPFWRVRKWWNMRVLGRKPKVGYASPGEILRRSENRPWWRKLLGLQPKARDNKKIDRLAEQRLEAAEKSGRRAS